MPPQRSAHVSFFDPAVLPRFFTALFFATFVVSLIVAAIHRQDVIHQRVMLEQESQHVLTLQQELLLFKFQEIQSDLLYLASQDTLTRFLSGDLSVRDGLEQDYMRFALRKGVYDQIRCLDTNGQEIARVNYGHSKAEIVPQQRLQSKAARYYYLQALSLDEGEVFVSPFDLNVEHGRIERPIKPVIRFLTPVFDDSGEKRGLLVLNYLGTQMLSNLKRISTGFRGQTMLVNSAGEYLQAPNPGHEWGWLLGGKRSFRSDFPAAWNQGEQLDAGRIRAGQNLFTFYRVSPGRRSTATQASSTAQLGDQDLGALILVSYVSSSVANARSRTLLGQLMLMCAGVMAVVVVLAWYWSRLGVIRKRHEQRIAQSEARLRQLSSRLLAVQETERRNLSRDLHDELGQQVTAISLDLQSLQKKDGDVSASPLIQRSIDGAGHLLTSLHEIATRVRPSVLDDLGLQDAVDSFVSEYQQRTGIKVYSQFSFPGRPIPGSIGENVFRILQESLANVAEHSHVNEVEVTIDTDGDLMRMTVVDFGTGFELENIKESTRLGILGMRERVELLNGQFDLQSTPGRGTQIFASIPLTENHEQAKAMGIHR